MLIDWFTVGAQALNFIILVWLLKRFLYKPVLSALDAREKRIAAELADAVKMKADAQKERDDFQRKSDEFDQQRARLMSKASDEAHAERQRLFDEAKKAVDVLSAKRQSAIRDDAAKLKQAIRKSAQREVFAIARKALTDLASASLEESMSDVFVRRLNALDGAIKESLCTALKAAAEPVLVRSAFDLLEGQQSEIKKALSGICAVDVPVKFETAPELIGGIELLASGQRIAWSIADYLVTLEDRLADLLKKKDSAPVTVEKPDAPQP